MRRVVSFFLAVLILAAGAASARGAASFADRFEEALSHYRKGRVQESLAAFQKLNE
ncbi:MAG TPA: hypothetical protein VLS90_05300 [Thermodesulfobacteriota bacterium]|nr:hypothetical protein [Thermodesulfobacteriota bacterium]